MIAVHDAEQILLAHLGNFGETTVPLSAALGRILAEPLIADRDFPPFHRVAMDGFAVAFDAIREGRMRFEVSHAQMAGAPESALSNPALAVEVMTGAVLPVGANVVIRLEDVEIQSNGTQKIIEVKAMPESEWQHIHLKGFDRKQGETIVQLGTRITPAEIAVAASIGKSTLRVYQIPRIAVVSTGDELVPIDQTPLPHQIRQSNAYTLQAFLAKMKIESDMFHLHDSRDEMETVLARLLNEYDVILTTGSVSAGGVDILPSVLTKLSVRKLIHKIEQRPGKPMWFGRKGWKFVFALPGNPVSIVVCFLKYVRMWLLRSMGVKPEMQLYASLESDIIFKPQLTYFLPVKLFSKRNGTLEAQPIKGHGSGDFANLVDCDGFLELPPEKTIFYSDEPYPVILYREIR
ncbi:MAG: molybdopterin molybdotransferase MoeA [Chloroherpetonaceae bacterium]